MPKAAIPVRMTAFGLSRMSLGLPVEHTYSACAIRRHRRASQADHTDVVPLGEQSEVVRIRGQNDGRRACDRDHGNDCVDCQITLLPSCPHSTFSKLASPCGELQRDRLGDQPLHRAVNARVGRPACDDLGRNDSRKDHALAVVSSRSQTLADLAIMATRPSQAF